MELAAKRDPSQHQKFVARNTPQPLAKHRPARVALGMRVGSGSLGHIMGATIDFMPVLGVRQWWPCVKSVMLRGWLACRRLQHMSPTPPAPALAPSCGSVGLPKPMDNRRTLWGDRNSCRLLLESVDNRALQSASTQTPTSSAGSKSPVRSVVAI